MKNPLFPALTLAALALPALAQSGRGSYAVPSYQQPNYYPGYSGPVYNMPGYRYGNYTYGTTPYYQTLTPSVYPYGGYAFAAPRPLANGLFSVGMGNYQFNMYRASSGYYYPFYGMPAGYTSAPPIIYQQGQASPQAQQPPISTMCADILSFLDTAKSKGQLTDGDFHHLHQRCVDIQSKERDLVVQGDGSLNADDEREIRKDLTALSLEISQRTKQ